MITVIVGLLCGASLISCAVLVAATTMSGRVQETIEAELALVTVESLRSIAEVELPKYNKRRRSRPVHVGV